MVVHGFELIKEQEIPEINSFARLYRHQKTGAELLSLENDDENKVFGITFRTPPEDSTGVPHIMEHAVLCGSRKYPVKEPFVELLKGSLKTFVNAFTYPDKTCYPVASQNLQDFYNLIDVYLDAVFYPLIPPHTLQQEGWHYELESVDAPLSYKGVVFNEMKGVYSSPDSLLGRHSLRTLFPDTTYGVDSGGDPAVIPDLTYEQFKQFHESYYHPSNARIFFYGDDPPEERLRLMSAWLEPFERIEVHSEVKLQPRFDEPKEISLSYDPGEETGEKKSMVTVNWLLPEGDDPQENLGLTILSHILLGTPASPLRKALIDSGLGEDLTGYGLDDDTRQMTFSTGLKGIATEDAGRVEALIHETLGRLAAEGIEPEMVEAAVNTIEFRLRENNTGSFPRGILLMLRALSGWLYDRDPFAPLAFEAPLNAIKERLAAGEPYFENLIRLHLLDNRHRTRVLLQPEPGLAQKQEAAERQRLEAARAEMTPEELDQLVRNTQELRSLQETPDSPEALATIPTLKLEDLDRENKLIPCEEFQAAGVQTLYHDLFTNGIVYLDLGFDLHVLPQDLLPYVPLFGRSLTSLGTETEDFVRLSQRIGRTTGGIRATTFTSSVRSAEQSAAWLFLRGKATMDHGADLLSILKDILLTVKLDNQERFRQMVLEEKAGLESGLIPGGHRVANLRLRSKFDEAGWASEVMGGVEYLFFLRDLATAVDQDWPGVLDKLEQVRKTLLQRGAMLGNVTLDRENWEQFRPQFTAFLAELPDEPRQPQRWQPEAAPESEGLTIPAQVNYVAKGANLYILGYELDGSIEVISNYLRTTWLWEKIRVQGGAYGGFCVFDRHSGVFSYLSYRDPNLLKSVESYDGTAQFLRQLDLSREELTKSIIGTIGDMDAYQLPDAKGYTSMLRYLIGETDEIRQQRREEVLSTTQADFHALGEALERLNEAGLVVVVGSQEAIRAANEARPGWLRITKIQ